MRQAIAGFVNKYMSIPRINGIDIVEIIIISFAVYEIMLWIKNTRAWMLLKGILVLLVFALLASVFRLNTILWIANRTLNVGIIAIIIVFQPELRKALEQLGKRKIIPNILQTDESRYINEKFSERTFDEMIQATYELAKTKTGALIVIENEILLDEYESTGIRLDSVISSQLLVNIFEHNTPLHDGAIIIRGNRIVAATCYLPLSDNRRLSKELGTRHRAGVGISEVTDALTIIVSEETGKVSVAREGILYRRVDGDTLRKMLEELQVRTDDKGKFRLWKGRKHNEKKINK